MAWISVEQTLIGKKLRVLAKDVGCSQNEAIGILINLWLWGMDNASMDGLMDGAEIADIALAIKPCLSESLDPEEVVSKLLDNGWIDCNEEELFIHDWEEYRYYYNKYVSEKKQHSKRQREYVARKRAAEKAATKLKEQKEQKLEKTVPEEKPVKKSPYTTAFETLWSAYPRKKDKGNAYKKYKARLNYDCSGLVINCLENAGIPAKQKGATYTGNMPEVLPNIGFKNVIASVNLSTGSGMKRGDVLLGNGHTAFYCGNGKLVHASINEKGTTTGGKSGDQTGREICIRSYYNKPWKYVYRYTGEVSNAGTVSVRNYLQKGDSGDAVKEMQKMLIGCGYSCGKSGVDGSFGGDTEKALLAFQEFYALEVDGKYGPASKAKLTSVYNGKQSAAAPEVAKSPQYTVGKAYTLQVELKVRTGPGTNYAAKKHSQLTADGQKHDKDNDGCLDAGTVITCKEVNVVGNDIWIKAPSGWMAGYYKGQVFIK